MELKEMRKFVRNKRALSTVISTLLMIMVAMVGMTVAFASVVVYADTYKNGVGGSVLESLTVEDVYENAEHNIVVTVYNPSTNDNLGTDVQVKVTGIYVDGGQALANVRGSQSSNINYNKVDFDEQTVAAGEHITFVGRANCVLSSGSHALTVATQRGSNFYSQFTAS